MEIKKRAIEYTMLAIEEIRKLSREMIAPQMDGETLSDYINKIIADIEFTTELKIKFTHDIQIELLSPGKKLTLYRIVQEQTKNIIKYSKAKEAKILLNCSNSIATMIITDNGVGFDPRKASNGVGLRSIKDRVKFYDGNTAIESVPGEGTCLTVNIPI